MHKLKKGSLRKFLKYIFDMINGIIKNRKRYETCEEKRRHGENNK